MIIMLPEHRHYLNTHTESKNQLIGIIQSNKPIYLIALETSGLNPMNDEVIAIRISKNHLEDNGLVCDEQNFILVRPENPISDTISKINGITNEELQKADDIEKVMSQIYEYVGDDANIIGWNVESFLLPFLKNAGFNSGYMLNIKYIADLMELCKMVLPPTKKFKSYSLNAVIDHLKLKDVADKVDGYRQIFNIISTLLPGGAEQATVSDARYWEKSYTNKYIFFDTDCGKVTLDCNTGYWIESTPGFFDTVDLDAFLSYVCEKRQVKSIWDFIKLYRK